VAEAQIRFVIVPCRVRNANYVSHACVAGAAHYNFLDPLFPTDVPSLSIRSTPITHHSLR
jgi:hypothetical protein